MPKYAIVFVTPENALVHRLVEMETKEAALRFFFDQYVIQGYSKDGEGFNYFREDFLDSETPLGSILEV